MVGLVAASQTTNLGDLSNNIAQGMRTIQVAGGLTTTTIAANSCVRNALADDCNWQLAARTGAQAHFAIIVDLYDNGTPADSSDDVTTLLGWALLTRAESDRRRDRHERDAAAWWPRPTCRRSRRRFRRCRPA